MSQLEGDGRTRRERLESDLLAGIISPEAVPDSDPPFGGERVWQMFMDLRLTRRSGFGEASITYVEIEAYSRVCRLWILPWEARALVSMDAAYAIEEFQLSKKTDKKAPAGKKAR